MSQGGLRQACSALLAVAALCLPAAAAQAQDGKTTSDWGFQITPYLWLAGIGGDITTPGGRSASFSQSIGDVLGSLDAGLMILGEVNYRRWHLLADFDYARLSQSKSPGIGEISLETREFLGTLSGGYRFVDSKSVSVDGFIGVRAMSLDNTLSFTGNFVLPPFSDGGSQTWADPLVGARVILPINADFFANMYADVGGGPNGDLTWQIYGGFGYHFNRTISGYFGYRYLAINHDADNLSFHLGQQGPLLGVGFRF
jgi:hypothetical protein